MKSYKLLLGCAALLAMTGCVSEDMTGSSDKGVLSLDVSTRQPTATRADLVDVTDYPVTIYKEDGTTRVESYETVASMPEKIRLDVGTYVLEAHTPGSMQRQMTYAYYKGTATSEIIKDVTTQTTIICKQQNGSIKVNYDEEFLSLFTAWTITFDDGGEQALSIKNTNGNAPAAVYWAFGENVDKLTVNFRGTTADGNTITASKLLTKEQATVTYDGETTNFGGGDAVVVNFTPVEATTGKVTISITANIVFTETSETVTINVVDNGTLTPENPDDPQNPDDPNTGDDAIVLTLPDPVTLSADDAATADPSSGDVAMTAEKGLKSVQVKVDSSSDEMMEQLAAVADEYPGVDLVNGCEVVGNQNLVAFLGSLGKTITVPAEGDTEYTFPVGQFYLFLGILPGRHNFIMTVTDMEGNTKTGTVVVTITE